MSAAVDVCVDDDDDLIYSLAAETGISITVIDVYLVQPLRVLSLSVSLCRLPAQIPAELVAAT